MKLVRAKAVEAFLHARRYPGFSLVLAAVAAAQFTPVMAYAKFENPFFLSDPGYSISHHNPPEVAVSPNGDAMFVWGKNDGGIEARTLSASGVLGPILALNEGQFGHGPQVGVAANGDAVFAWKTGSEIQGRTLSAGGELGPIFKVGNSKHGFLHVAVDADGSAVFAWTERQREAPGDVLRLKSRSRSAAGVRGPIHDIDSAPTPEVISGDSGADSFAVAISAGRAAFVWTSGWSYGATRYNRRVWARLQLTNGGRSWKFRLTTVRTPTRPMWPLTVTAT